MTNNKVQTGGKEICVFNEMQSNLFVILLLDVWPANCVTVWHITVFNFPTYTDTIKVVLNWTMHSINKKSLTTQFDSVVYLFYVLQYSLPLDLINNWRNIFSICVCGVI